MNRWHAGGMNLNKTEPDCLLLLAFQRENPPETPRMQADPIARLILATGIGNLLNCSLTPERKPGARHYIQRVNLQQQS
jgi:hypothetical protein